MDLLSKSVRQERTTQANGANLAISEAWRLRIRLQNRSLALKRRRTFLHKKKLSRFFYCM